MGQMWSLSLEEQFYLLGAVATYLAIKRGWVRQLAAVLAAFVLFVWVARAIGHGGPGQFWFQRPDAPTPEGRTEQRWHFDVWVPYDRAESRIAAALAAGGTMVDASNAPSFWVLADADGNKACICTWQGRA